MSFIEDLFYALLLFGLMLLGHELLLRVAEAGSWLNFIGG